MKKILALIMALGVLLSLASCEAGGKAVKTGMGVVIAASGTGASEDGDGSVQVNGTVAAVLLDANGKIVDCVIDVAQNKMGFTGEGTVLDADKTFQTKKELKENYGMKGVSGIGKEWYEQAEAFEKYVIGKTADEVKGIAVDDHGYPTDAALTAGCTMGVTDYIDAVVKACANAVDAGAKEGDKLGLAIQTAMDTSVDASEDGDGKVVAYSHYAAVTLDKDGKVTSVEVDASQGSVSFDTEGQITSDLNAEIKTKAEKKEEYGMKGISPIGKEWYEQADAFEKYIVGKTASEITGIAVDDHGYPTDAALTAGCTMGVAEMKAVVALAASYAN